MSEVTSSAASRRVSVEIESTIESILGERQRGVDAMVRELGGVSRRKVSDGRPGEEHLFLSQLLAELTRRERRVGGKTEQTDAQGRKPTRARTRSARS